VHWCIKVELWHTHCKDWAESPPSFDWMNSKPSKGTGVVVSVMGFVDRVDTWVMEAVVLPEGPSISPKCCKHDFDGIVSVAVKICCFTNCLLEGCLVAIPLHSKRPGANSSHNPHAKQSISSFLNIER